jgi:hypothetical protein
MRRPPEFIEVLLPVWGERYTRDFVDVGLPSLLAPGNLPALSRLGRCTFVLLAPARDADVIEKSALWPLMRACCAVRVTSIDDLVSSAGSTVLTLAYALAIRMAGERALDTCFVPLVADYVVADGSLRAVVERVLAGASGVLAGNFQIARELAIPQLQRRKSETGVLAIAPRALVALSLGALHHATLGEIVDEKRELRPTANRLFWRVDEGCLVGRFFLMHMIALRPERRDFIIAAPSDYSLVPELCPAGEIVRMTDSDTYFVVECQAQGDVPPPGRIEPRSVARALAVWATALHRDNARHALLFHAGAPPRRLPEAIAASAAFVSEVDAHHDAPPKPFRHHPSWIRALDHHISTARLAQDRARLAWITGDGSLATRRGAVPRLRAMLLGRAPDFRPWHPRWPDVRALARHLSSARGDVAFVSDASARVRAWLDNLVLERGGRSVVHLCTADIRDRPVTPAAVAGTRFDSLFVIVDQGEVSEVLRRLAALIKPDGVVVLAIGQLFAETEIDLQRAVMPDAGTFAGSGLSLEKTSRVVEGAWRVAIQATMMQYARRATGGIGLRTPYWLAMAGGLAVMSMVCNIAGGRRRGLPDTARASSLFLTLRKGAMPVTALTATATERTR